MIYLQEKQLPWAYGEVGCSFSKWLSDEVVYEGNCTWNPVKTRPPAVSKSLAYERATFAQSTIPVSGE